MNIAARNVAIVLKVAKIGRRGGVVGLSPVRGNETSEKSGGLCHFQPFVISGVLHCQKWFLLSVSSAGAGSRRDDVKREKRPGWLFPRSFYYCLSVFNLC